MSTLKESIDWAHLGRIFAGARNSKNISQQTASEMLNVTRASIANFERGNQKFPIERLIQLAGLYDLKLELFIVEGLACHAMSLVDNSTNMPFMIAQTKEELIRDAQSQGYGKTEEELVAKGYTFSPIIWSIKKPEAAATKAG
ncbi:MAG: helix-turn-helix transcriptional regulator [Hafnia sp.]